MTRQQSRISVRTNAFGPSLGDGYVISLYGNDLESGDLMAHGNFVDAEDPGRVLVASGKVPDRQLSMTVRRQMTWEADHVGALRHFGRSWFVSLEAEGEE